MGGYHITLIVILNKISRSSNLRTRGSSARPPIFDVLLFRRDVECRKTFSTNVEWTAPQVCRRPAILDSTPDNILVCCRRVLSLRVRAFAGAIPIIVSYNNGNIREGVIPRGEDVRERTSIFHDILEIMRASAYARTRPHKRRGLSLFEYVDSRYQTPPNRKKKPSPVFIGSKG